MRSTSLVAAGSFLGLLLPFLPQDRPAQAKPGQDQPPAAGQDQHPTPKKTGVHQTFASLAGDYDVAMKFTMPDGNVVESKATASMSSILDGRFLLEHNQGEMMGKKFKGLRIYGWNAEAKQFEGLWLYTESNAMMRLSGKAGSDRNSVDFEAVVQETADSKMTLEVKARRNQDGTLVFALVHKDADGKAMGTFEETYTRKK